MLSRASPPQSQLDEYKEGQEDEGEAPGGEPWSDREGPSEEEDEAAGIVREVSRAGLSEQQQLEVGDITERLRHVDDMLALAHGFGNPHVVMTLEQARRALVRQITGAKQVGPAVAVAARDLRLRQEGGPRSPRAM